MSFVNPFTDISQSDWFYNEVKFVYVNGLMQGTLDNKFSPYLTTTRGMIVTILYSLEDEPGVTGGGFTDVADGAWYADAVAWAAANGIVSGYGGGLFGPNDSITREQMAVILYNYAKFMGYDVSDTAALSGFNDSSQISAWAQDAMRWAVGAGLIGGKGGGKLDPDGTATRAEIAAILQRLERVRGN